MAVNREAFNTAMILVNSSPIFRNALWKLTVQMAWAAGLFEGEGCFCVHMAKHPPRKTDGGISYINYPCAQISMTDKDVLDRFVKVVRIGKVYGPYNTKRKDGRKHKPTYQWTVTNKQALKIAEMFGPFLLGRRNRQIISVLKQCGRFGTRLETWKRRNYDHE